MGKAFSFSLIKSTAPMTEATGRRCCAFRSSNASLHLLVIQDDGPQNIPCPSDRADFALSLIPRNSGPLPGPRARGREGMCSFSSQLFWKNGLLTVCVVPDNFLLLHQQLMWFFVFLIPTWQYVFIEFFRERGREKERDRQIHVREKPWSVASCTYLDQDLTHNLLVYGMTFQLTEPLVRSTTHVFFFNF